MGVRPATSPEWPPNTSEVHRTVVEQRIILPIKIAIEELLTPAAIYRCPRFQITGRQMWLLIIVSWPGVVRSMFITSIYWCIRIGHLSIIDYNFSGLSADIDLQSTWPPMVGTPFDLRPDMRRYLSDVSRMVRRWELSMETSGFFFYCPINYLMLPERPRYRAGTMSVRSATSPK